MEIISIEEIEQDPDDEYVYDLETEVGTFVAGTLSKGILVKNTDSCYVKFPIHKSDYESDEEFMKAEFEIAEKCAKFCTSKFKPPMELAFEKYMYPLVLFAKKRYAYTEWTNPKTPDKDVHYKGLQLVRRDTCKYVKEELDHIFQIIMKERSKEAAYKATLEFTKQSIQNLLNGNIDPNKLVLSKQLKSKYVVRKNKISKSYHWTNEDIQQPHVRLAQQLKIKDPANHPKPPDRVPYLFVEKKGDNVLQCEKVIHPVDFDSNYKLDSMYYFDHQYKKPLDMVFQFMTPNPESIYKGLLFRKINEMNGQSEISNFFKPKSEKKVIVTEFEFKPEMLEELAETEGYDGSRSEGSEETDSEESISEDLFMD